MSGGPGAVLAFGIDLGTMEDFKAQERDKYGFPNLPWFDLSDDFADVALKRLARAHDPLWPTAEGPDDYVRGAYGVEFATSGDLTTGSTGTLLIASGSMREVEWTDTLALDPGMLAGSPGWDHRLGVAVASLDIHPTQERPAWLMFACRH